jgi:hypothetical protein
MLNPEWAARLFVCQDFVCHQTRAKDAKAKVVASSVW